MSENADAGATALESHLAVALDADAVTTEEIADGLNRILTVSTADGKEYVLRQPRQLRETAYMNDVETEYEVMRRLRDTDVPAPEPVHLCEDRSILGDPFFVMTRREGEPVHLGSDLPERFRNPGSRREFAQQVVEAMAAVHTVDPGTFEGVCGENAPREEIAEARERFEESREVTGRDLPRIRSVGDWLVENAPEEYETGLVHGDFRPGNLLLSGSDAPEVTAVLDWETAVLGDPLTELGYLLLRWRDEGDPTPDVDAIAEKYPDQEGVIAQLRERNEHGMAPFSADPGSPTRRELVARYEELTGLEYGEAEDRYYRAHATYLLASVWEDLHRRCVERGEESDWEPHVEYVARLADGIASGEFPL